MAIFTKIFTRLLLAFAVVLFLGVTVACSEDDIEELEIVDGNEEYNDEDTDTDEKEEGDTDTDADDDEDDDSESEDDDDDDSEGEDVSVQDGVLKILAIGNSFSQDAVEQYLYELYKAAGIESVIGNLYIGGCSLETHYNNAVNGSNAYSYRKIVSGTKTETQNVAMVDGIKDENWDYISLQQVSGLSGLYETYTPYLPYLVQFVSENALSSETQVILHQTWAYASNSTHEDFSKYDNDQMKMYSAIVSTVNQAAEDNGISIIIPSGTAIQNGRNSWLGDTFNRDGYHLETTYGRYTAACAWFEKLSGIDVTTNTYAPDTINEEVKDVVTHAAHFAVQMPDSVNSMEDWQAPDAPVGELSSPVRIDFGSNMSSSSPWNNVTMYSLSSTDDPLYLIDSNEEYTSLSITEITGFTTLYAGVGSEPTNDLIVGDMTWPESAWKDGIEVEGTKGEGNTAPANIVISGFNPDLLYDFSIVAVRWNGSHDARKSQYYVTGATESDTKEIYPGMQTWSDDSASDYEVTFSSVAPSASGTVTISVVGVDTNTVAEGHINAMTISATTL